MKIVKAPESFLWDGRKIYIFLAGSIEMGQAENWQEKVEKFLNKDEFKDCIILNPRRTDWDSSWGQSIKNPQFYEQVIWEIDCQERADIVFMYFSPGTKSPITLLELGLFARLNKLIVVCPEGFWRKGNVDIVCNTYNIPLYDNLEAGIEALKERVIQMSEEKKMEFKNCMKCSYSFPNSDEGKPFNWGVRCEKAGKYIGTTFNIQDGVTPIPDWCPLRKGEK